MLVKRRRPQLDPNGWKDRPLHWASVLIAREHRQEDPDGWTCDCVECDRVRAELYHTGTFAEVRTAMNGGA